MTEITQLMNEFTEAYLRDASTDPRAFLARVEGVDREELRLLIEGFLERAPQQAWDQHAFSGSMAERALSRAGEAGSPGQEASEGWPSVLPELRNRARLTRGTVVKRLAEALGFADNEDRVAVYYHQMEQGQLSPSGVSTRVLEKLAEIVGVTAGVLRRSGQAGESTAGTGGEVFARVGMASPATVEHSSYDAMIAEDIEQADELDLLFTGGD